MQGGYNRKSKAAKILEGTFNTTRDSITQPDIPLADHVGAPGYLQGYALECWLQHAELLKEHRILTNADLVTLEKFCVAYAIFRTAYEALEREGLVTEHPSRGPVKNPAYDMWKGAMAETRQHASALGLDPFSRGRLDVSNKPDESNPFANL